jgi:hypothetical protein
MHTRTYLGLLGVSLLALTACTADAGEDVDGDQGAATAGRTVGQYVADVSVMKADGQPYDPVTLKDRGFTCMSSLHTRYGETVKNPTGRSVAVYTDGDFVGNGAFFADDKSLAASTNFARDFLSSAATFEVSAHVSCAGMAGPKHERRQFTNTWVCRTTNLPSSADQPREETCQGNFSGNMQGVLGETKELLDGLATATVKVKLQLKSKSELYDVNTCPKDTTGLDRFSLRVTQGLKGSFGEDNFRLNLKLDDQSIEPIRSKSGIFSHAISFCRPHKDSPLLRVALSGAEEDLIFDDIYTSAPEDNNVLVKPGTRHEFKLLRGKEESFVVVELFADQ